jgi:general secretion pathway protein A
MSEWTEWPVEGWPEIVRYGRAVLGQIADQMTAGFRVSSWGGVEVGGVLLGTREGSSFSITDYRPVDCEHAHGPSYELTDRDRESMQKVVELARSEGLEAVGWYKSVSNRELAISEADEAVWAALFPEGVLLILRRAKEGVDGGATYCRADGRISSGRRTLEADALASSHAEAAGAEASPIPKAAPRPLELIEPPAVVAAAQPRLPIDAFALTPDPEFFYPSPVHREALASLEYGITSRKGFVMLLGNSGMGKTMVLECLSDRLKAAGIEYGFLFNSRLTRYELFELLALDFDLKPSSNTKTAVLMALNSHLIRRADLGLTTALLIDDAQKLNAEVLEELESLSNLETRKGKLLQVVMAARPEFETRMNQPELAGLRQRFVLRSRLRPLSNAETAEYIRTRLERAGELGVASALPIDEIHRLSCGVPRLISAICGQLLERRGRNDPQTALTEVADELGLTA